MVKRMTKSSPMPDCCATALGDVLRPELFKALCDPVRVSIVALLATRAAPSTVSEIAESCGIDFSGVSRHLKMLRDAGVLSVEREGRKALYRLDAEMLALSLRCIADAIEACRSEAV